MKALVGDKDSEWAQSSVPTSKWNLMLFAKYK